MTTAERKAYLDSVANPEFCPKCIGPPPHFEPSSHQAAGKPHYGNQECPICHVHTDCIAYRHSERGEDLGDGMWVCGLCSDVRRSPPA